MVMKCTSMTFVHVHPYLSKHVTIHMYFLHIAADAEVISIDTFVKEPNGVIIGVTLVKVSHIYDCVSFVHCSTITCHACVIWLLP